MPARVPPCRRPRAVRLIRYRVRRTTAAASAVLLRVAAAIDVWIYLAAAALVGFEGLEVLFSSVLFAPEFVPLILVMLAMLWVLKHHGRRLIRLLRLARLRARRRRARDASRRRIRLR